MTEKDEERPARWEGHRYDAPESDETRRGKEWTTASWARWSCCCSS